MQYYYSSDLSYLLVCSSSSSTETSVSKTSSSFLCFYSISNALQRKAHSFAYQYLYNVNNSGMHSIFHKRKPILFKNQTVLLGKNRFSNGLMRSSALSVSSSSSIQKHGITFYSYFTVIAYFCNHIVQPTVLTTD